MVGQRFLVPLIGVRISTGKRFGRLAQLEERLKHWGRLAQW